MADKIFMILEAIAKTKGINSVSIIQQLTGFPRSTTHRILQSMEECGMIIYTQDKGYGISQKLQFMCLENNQNTDFLELMIPLVKNISERTHETVSVNVLNDMERTCIYRIEGDKPAIRNIQMGERGPLLVGSAGRVLAAYLSPIKLEEALKYGEKNGVITPLNKKEVLDHIEQCRKDGYAVSIEERYEGCWSVAVPIISGITKEIIGTISISSILSSFSENVEKAYIRILQEAVDQIKYKLLI